MSNGGKIRLVGNVLPRYVYWIVTNEGKKRPIECISFDRESESFNGSRQDPMQEIDSSIYSEKPVFAYVCNAIDRSDGQVKLVDLKKTIYNSIIDLAKNPEYGNPAHPDSGYDVTIKKEKTGPLAQNVKYHVTPGRNSSPLTEEEKAMELFELDTIFKTQTYEEQKKWLIENTSYFTNSVGGDFRPDETAEDLV